MIPQTFWPLKQFWYPKIILVVQKSFLGTLNAIELLFPSTKLETSLGLSNINVVGESSEICLSFSIWFISAYLLIISKLEAKIASARIIDKSKLPSDKVLLYSEVEIKNMATGAIIQYMLVPESEADLSSKKISISSPISKGLLGKKIGDLAVIKIPSGMIEFKILSISRK